MIDNSNICKNCGEIVKLEQLFCRGCGCLSLGDDLEVEQILNVPIEVVQTKGRGITLIEVFIVLAIIGILAAIAVPPRRHYREPAREKSCYANMRVILGAIEMYNMDNQVMETKIDDAVLDKLVSGGYLKSIPKCPTVGGYSSIGDMSADGRPVCFSHGTVE